MLLATGFSCWMKKQEILSQSGTQSQVSFLKIERAQLCSLVSLNPRGRSLGVFLRAFVSLFALLSWQVWHIFGCWQQLFAPANVLKIKAAAVWCRLKCTNMSSIIVAPCLWTKVVWVWTLLSYLWIRLRPNIPTVFRGKHDLHCFHALFARSLTANIARHHGFLATLLFISFDDIHKNHRKMLSSH